MLCQDHRPYFVGVVTPSVWRPITLDLYVMLGATSCLLLLRRSLHQGAVMLTSAEVCSFESF